MTNVHLSLTAYRTYGDAILARLAGAKPPASLKASIKAFSDAQRAYQAASDKSEAARAVRDAALAAIGDADHALDTSVLGLADQVVGAGMGNRKSPFTGFSKHTPTDLCGLPYATEIVEVKKLIVAVLAKKPAASVKAAAAACTKNAAAVTSALGGLTKPQADYSTSLAARDATLLGWQKALTRLKKFAAAAWIDAPAQVKAIFAPPEKVQAPVHKRGKKAVAAPAAS